MALASGDIFYLQTGTTPKKTTIDDISTYVQNAVGTTEHTAADTTALVALTGITIGDRVFVTDASGDSTVTSGWAIYRADVANPTTIAAGTGYRKIVEQEGLDITVTANLGYTASATQGVVTSSAGTDATLPAADGTNAGLLLPADFTKLSFLTVTSAVNLDTLSTNTHVAATLAAGDNPLTLTGQEFGFDISSLPTA